MAAFLALRKKDRRFNAVLQPVLLRRTGLIGFAEVGHALLFNEEALARQEFHEALYDSVECSSPAVGTRTSWNIGTPSVAR